MAINLTSSQLQRINELDAGSSGLSACAFNDAAEREAAFNEIVADLSLKNRENVRKALARPSRTYLATTINEIARSLIRQGFTEVSTPTIISENAVRRMGIGEDHPLNRQIFWLDGKRCLRPMLAPNLYKMMIELDRNARGHFGIFEVGTCFRKESKGAHHLEEFTMLNLVEIRPERQPEVRLREILSTILDPLGLEWSIETELSDVYGETWDVIVDGTELASAAAGPHPLDAAHGVDFPWMGIGMGIERLNMLRNGSRGIRRYSSSLSYLNGWRIDI